jgi:hypothetical protein
MHGRGFTRTFQACTNSVGNQISMNLSRLRSERSFIPSAMCSCATSNGVVSAKTASANTLYPALSLAFFMRIAMPRPKSVVSQRYSNTVWESGLMIQRKAAGNAYTTHFAPTKGVPALDAFTANTTVRSLIASCRAPCFMAVQHHLRNWVANRRFNALSADSGTMCRRRPLWVAEASTSTINGGAIIDHERRSSGVLWRSKSRPPHFSCPKGIVGGVSLYSKDANAYTDRKGIQMVRRPDGKIAHSVPSSASSSRRSPPRAAKRIT